MADSLFDLSGRVALVTGAGSGMGRAMATGFAEYGADVMAVDINLESAQRTVSELSKLGRKAVAVQCDIQNPDQITATFEQLDREFGHIDVLASVAGPAAAGKPEELALASVQYSLQTAIGKFVLCQQAGRRMLKQGKGSIINIGSLAAVSALGRGHVAYSMAMGAVVQMTRELSTEWSSRGVRVNAILPAQILNKGLEQRMAANPALQELFIHGIAMRRLGLPEEIKGLAIFLASDASSFITGALIPFDGGNLAKNAGGSSYGEAETL